MSGQGNGNGNGNGNESSFRQPSTGNWVLPKMEYGLEPPDRNEDNFKFKPSFWPVKDSDSSFNNKIQLLLPDQRRELFYMRRRTAKNPEEKMAAEKKRSEYLANKEGKTGGALSSGSYDAKVLLQKLSLEAKFSDNVLLEETILRPYRDSAAKYNELMTRFEKSDLNPNKNKRKNKTYAKKGGMVLSSGAEKDTNILFSAGPEVEEEGTVKDETEEGDSRRGGGGGEGVGALDEDEDEVGISASEEMTRNAPEGNLIPLENRLVKGAVSFNLSVSIPPLQLPMGNAIKSASVTPHTYGGLASSSNSSSIAPHAPFESRSQLGGSSRADISPRLSSSRGWGGGGGGGEATTDGEVVEATSPRSVSKLAIALNLRVKSFIVLARMFKALQKIKMFTLGVRGYIDRQGIRWKAAKVIKKHYKNYRKVCLGLMRSRNVWINIAQVYKVEAKRLCGERTTACNLIIEFCRSVGKGVRQIVSNYVKCVRRLQVMIRNHLRRNLYKRQMVQILLDRFLLAVIPSVQCILSPGPIGLDVSSSVEQAKLVKQLGVSDSVHRSIRDTATPTFHAYLRNNLSVVKEFYRSYQLSNGRTMPAEKRKSIITYGIFRKRRKGVYQIELNKNLLSLPVYTDSDAAELLATGYDKLTENINDFLRKREEDHNQRHNHEFKKQKGLEIYFCNMYSTLTSFELFDMCCKMYDPFYTDAFLDGQKHSRAIKRRGAKPRGGGGGGGGKGGEDRASSSREGESAGGGGGSSAEARGSSSGFDNYKEVSGGGLGLQEQELDAVAPLQPSQPSKEKSSKAGSSHPRRNISK